MDQQQFIDDMFQKGILVSKEMLEKKITSPDLEALELEGDLVVVNPDYMDIISQRSHLVNWYEMDELRTNAEMDRDDDLYQTQLQNFKQASLAVDKQSSSDIQEIASSESAPKQEPTISIDFNEEAEFEDPLEYKTTSKEIEKPLSEYNVEVTLSFNNIPVKFQVSHFTKLFAARYKFLEGILRGRKGLRSAMPIRRLLAKKEKEQVAAIGILSDMHETKNGSLILTIEDLTAQIKILVSKNRQDLFKAAKDLVFDEVIGIVGTLGDGIIFSDELIWPDIPRANEMKKGPTEEYIAFLSDFHVGSTYFMEEEFMKFIKWINGEVGNETQRSIANAVKYIVIAGDLVDGVGIYPGHQGELTITDITEQFNYCAKLLKMIPSDKQIIMCPGNHDAVHLAEPQTAFNKDFAGALFEMDNVTIVTNPGAVNIGKTKTFEGFNILLYHGYSFDYYAANVESIRMNGGYHRADLIMKFLLKRRHLAPAYKSTPYLPVHNDDPLLVKKIPDFFITGHIHYSSVANYKGVTMICGSCWQGMTSFQEKLGHQPEPGRVPVVNLKTRDIKILRFA